MQHLKIFGVESRDSTLIVTPRGEGSAFRYQDLHLETNAIRAKLATPQFRNLIIDLTNMEYFGSEFIGALVSLLREVRTRKGRGCLCCASPQMLQVLQNMSLLKLWPHYESLQDALAEVAAVPT